MQNWKKFPRFILFIILLTSLLASLSAPVFVKETVSAAPLGASALALDVIISEIAWGGTPANSADEWIELYNTTNSPINLSGWTLAADDGDPSIILTGTIAAGGYYLLENGDDATISNITANQIYSGSLSNSGEVLRLKDTASNTIDTANNDGTLAWDRGSEAPNYSSMERIHVVVDSLSAWVTNNNTGIGLGADNNPIKGTPGTSSEIDLSLKITVDNTAPVAGGTVTFTLALTNNNLFYDATNVIVRDSFSPPATTTLSSPSYVGSTLGTYVAGTWTVPTLTRGTTATLTISAIAAGGVNTYLAEIDSFTQTDIDSIPGNASTTEDDDDFIRVGSPTLGITNTVNNPTPSIGANVVFTITVSNPATNPGSATNVNIDALLPGGATYISHSVTSFPIISSAYNANSGVWTIVDPLGTNGSATLNITSKIVTNGMKNFVAVVSSNEFANNSAVAIVNPLSSTQADLSLTQTWSRSTSAAGRVDLKITVVNQETVNTATNVQVKDLLPSGLTYFSHTSGMTYNSTTGIWAVGTLAPSASSTLTIIANVSSSGTSTTNFAEVWQSDQYDTDSTPGNGDLGEDDDTSLEVTVADLRLTETVDIAGSNAVFTIIIYNTGPDDATNVIVKNSQLVPSYTYVSHSNTAGTYNIATGDWTIPTVLDGGSATLTVTTTIPGPLSVNWAQVSAVNEVDPDSLPANCLNTVLSCIEDDDAAAPAADLFLTQSVNNANPDIGTNVVFTITVSNAGVAGTTGVEVKDLLPSGLTYMSYASTPGTTYSNSTGIWTIGTLANGANSTLNITAKVAAGGVNTNWAEVWRSVEPDPDSTPGNGSTIEDDDGGATITSYRSILVNEVAWAGTAASPTDEWIELYNPSNASINITGWTLKSTSGSLNITLSGTITSGGYFLLEREDNFTVSDVTADQIYPGVLLNLLSDGGEILTLRDGSGNFIDTANGNGGSWPDGSLSPNYGTMERQGTSVESDNAWVTNKGNPKNGKDANNGLIYGTPRKVNSTGIAPVPTSPASIPTSPFIAPVGRPVISEILPRPGFDWNQDGTVDVFDEFIEIKNLGPVDINIGGWILDDDANKGSDPFTLPDITLKPGEHHVLYGLQTNILLSDGGDTVRLLNPSNKVFDAYTYKIAKTEDESICRLPDTNLFGAWFEDCTPTPSLTNTREGIVPSMPEEGFESPVCALPDTLPADFLFAECRGYGAKIWNSFYWNKEGWLGDQFVAENLSKWESFVK